MKCYSLSLLLLLSSLVGNAQTEAPIDSLFMEADVVVSGEIIDVVAGFVHDLGTETYYVTLKVDRVFKQNFNLQMAPFEFVWEVSNLRCHEVPMGHCVWKYQGRSLIFFLDKKHFTAGEELQPSHIRVNVTETTNSLSRLEEASKFYVFHHATETECNVNCKFCKSIETEDWKSVENKLKGFNGQYTDLQNHRNVKWVMPDRFVLASIPTWQNVRYRFITNYREIDGIANYQIGKANASSRTWKYWLHSKEQRQLMKSHMGGEGLKWFRIEEDTDTSYDLWKHFRIDLQTKISDSSWTKEFGVSPQIPDKLVKMISLYEWDFKLYRDYKPLPIAEYSVYAKNYIDSLVKYEKVYSLCVIAMHNVPEVATYSLRKLAELNDHRSVPFLFHMLEYYENQYATGLLTNQNELIVAELAQTLGKMMGTKTLESYYPYEVSTDVPDLMKMYPIWKSRIVETD